MREAPFFSTQIALMRAGELILGVSNAWAYGEIAFRDEIWIKRPHPRCRIDGTKA